MLLASELVESFLKQFDITVNLKIVYKFNKQKYYFEDNKNYIRYN